MILFENHYILAIVSSLAVGLAVAFLLYVGKSNNHFPRGWRIVLAFLRFSAVSLLMLLLSSLLFTQKMVTTSPSKVVVAFDYSASIPDSAISYYKQVLQTLQEVDPQTTFLPISFGENTVAGSVSEVSKNATDFQKLTSFIEEKFMVEDMEAMLLFTDGIATCGESLPYALSSLSFPVYSVVMGDTTHSKDVYIANLLHNDKVLKGNSTPVEVYINADNALGEQLKVALFKDNRMIASTTLDVNSKVYSSKVAFNPTLTKTGVQQLEVRVDPISSEQNNDNNRRSFFVEVREEKSKIVLVAQAPHPDISAIKSALSTQDEYEVSTCYIDTFEPIDDELGLVIFHQLPSAAFSCYEIVNSLKEKRIPVLFILSPQVNSMHFNKLYPDFQLVLSSNEGEKVQGDYNDAFSLFAVQEQTKEFIATAPPLVAPFATVESGDEFQVEISQRIHNIATQQPLSIYGTSGNYKRGFILGEGIWRWRMYDFKTEKQFARFDNWIISIARFMLFNHSNSPLYIEAPNKASLGEEISFYARFYDESGEVIPNQTIALELTDTLGNELTYTFIPKQSGHYLSLKGVAEGYYHWKATVRYGSRSFTKTGRLLVEDVAYELMNRRPDVSALRRLAANSGGQLLWPTMLDSKEEIAQLIGDIDPKPTQYEVTNYKYLIKLVWIMVIILSLLSIEWLIRKRLNGIE